MGRRNTGLAWGFLLGGALLWVLQLLMSGLSLLALVVAFGWLCYRIIKRLVAPLCGRIWKELGNLWRWWWGKLWEDPLERAQREALREIQRTVHYYVEIQRRANEWADDQEDQTARVQAAV